MSNEQIESTEGSETCTGLTMGYLAQKYTEWCKDTKRNGSVLIGGSMLDFFKWLTSQRAAFIKGCQYAATGSLPMTREEADKWFRTWLQERDHAYYVSGKVEAALAMYDHLASLSPAEPGYSREQMRQAIRRARICDRTGSYPTPDEIISLLNKQI